MDRISRGHYHRPESLDDLAELPRRNQGGRSPQHQQKDAKAERKAALRPRFRQVSHHLQEQTKTFDDKAEPHQGYRTALPGKQGAFGREQHPRIFSVGHTSAPSMDPMIQI